MNRLPYVSRGNKALQLTNNFSLTHSFRETQLLADIFKVPSNVPALDNLKPLTPMNDFFGTTQPEKVTSADLFWDSPLQSNGPPKQVRPLKKKFFFSFASSFSSKTLLSII